MLFRLLAVLVLFGFIYSCTTGVKYPSYRIAPSATSLKSAPRSGSVKREGGFVRGISLLKHGRCAEAIAFFKRYSSFRGRYCLMVAYGYCGDIARAKRVFGTLEGKATSNRWEGRLYATMGFFLMLDRLPTYRDYLAVAYAYDASNPLALALMRKPRIRSSDKRLYFNRIFSWCDGR